MRVRGLGYWIGAGLGAAGLVGIVLWVSMVSARPGTQVVLPDQAADIVAEKGGEPGSGRSEAGQQTLPEPIGLDTALNRLQSRPVTGPTKARDHADKQALEKAADTSAVADTDGDDEPSSRVLRVEIDGAESEVQPFDDTPAAGGDVDDDDPGSPSSTAEPPPGTTAKPYQDDSGGKSDKRRPLNDPETSPPGRSDRGSKPTADNEHTATSTTAEARKRSTTTTTARPTTRSAAEQTTIKAPTTNSTASTTTRPPTTAKPIATASTGGGGNTAAEQRVIELTNDARRQAGCPALVHNDKLRLAAYLHSKDMSDNDYFKHTGLDGSSPGDRISRQGYEFRTWAENIAWGYRTPEAVVEGWMNSSGHRANILNCSLTELGVGFHDYYWTQNFGTPR